uniref:Uncharacterized protein n=1 Tax=Grammatophora oceanica TaxID=210454 RepID=A0A7S1YAZ3_9STRA
MPEADFEERSKLFAIRKVQDGKGFSGKGYAPGGTELSHRAWDGLVRRLLHAVMTNDSFNVILGGHSAAAGHGNHFKQAYIMQFHKVAEPVFALLGMDLTSRNLAQGGLGTLEHSLGARSMYGSDVDIQLWDSGMTEGRDPRAVDLFHRQSILGSDRAPLQLGDQGGHISILHEHGDADVGMIGEGNQGLLPTIGSEEQAQNVPYAVRYMKCTPDRGDLCKQHKYQGKCWIDGQWDQYNPTNQNKEPGSRVNWHPGNRFHQILGRNLAFTVLLALKEGLQKWKDAPDYALPDEAWHVTAYYQNIQNKVRNIPDSVGACPQGNPALSKRFCNMGVRYAATEFTPRPFPDATSLQSIMVKANEGYGGGGVPHYTQPMVYTGPGPHNPSFDIPEGQIDVLAIVSNGRDIPPYPVQPKPQRHRQLDGEPIESGLGWQPSDMRNGYCDGTWNMECNRPADEQCLLSGHADSRGGWIFGGLSGWMVFNLKDVRDGLIALKIETWHSQKEVSIAQDWTTVNGKLRRRNLRSVAEIEEEQATDDNNNDERMMAQQEERELKQPPPGYCPEFRFEYAIDGEVVASLDQNQFGAWMKPVQRVVEIGVVMDDPNFEGPKDVQLAIRQVGCAQSSLKAMKLTHVYWS